MPSLRLAPQQLAAGLTVDGTRMQQDLQALANRLNAPLPTDIMRRWYQTNLTFGYIPDTLSKPNQLPWMNASNSAAKATTTTQQPVTLFANPYRQKGIAQPDISPEVVPVNVPAANSDIYSWEVSWSQTKPCLLDKWTVTLAVDTCYMNTFTWGADAPTGKVPGAFVDDLVLQVQVDSALDSPNRTASLLPVLLRNFDVSEYAISYISTTEDMQPPLNNGTAPIGLCIQINARQPIPENAKIRLIISLPKYPASTDTVIPVALDVSSWTQYPWQTAIFSSHVQLLEPISE